ncbi:hypothetical protein N7478_008412 [Penicillium angulare]|uniref:uncharacterized protein n=1 Tax=Penicillium angulare TaxID=116970 RepID=UPI0025413E7A|nr:uncharacterized protein N7478_008412 [Penicillium angulare]KAJ5273287.1 hypothetical protein N7478_008412 [Penicillium angulare]
MQACDRCRKRKSRCDRLKPSCRLCSKAGAVCVYTDRTKEPTVRRDVVEKLEYRLRQTEEHNRLLTARLETLTSNAPDVNNSPPANEGRNEISDEVSFLSLNAGGQRQYLGSTSGLLLADLLKSAIETDKSSSRTLRAQNLRPIPVSAKSPASIQRSTLINEGPSYPPESLARDLHDAFFKHDHICYPIISEDLAKTNLSRIYADPSILENKPYESFVFYMIVAISTSHVQKLHWQSLPEAEMYQAKGISKLGDILSLGGLEALQAILLLCQYWLTSSTQETSASLWHMVGVAARMCFEMGLHREQGYGYRENFDVAQQSISAISRRCFWCLLAMDRVLSITLGRPLAINIEDVNLALPDCEAAQFPSLTERSEMISTENRQRIAAFVHITRYRIICGKIMTSLHQGCHDIDEALALNIQADLFNELERWRLQTPSLKLNPCTGLSTISWSSSFLTPQWYELLYHNALLMLYRPSPALPLNSSRASVVLPIIYSSAKQSIDYYSHLHGLSRMNYTWITLHSVFMAGLSFLYAAGRHFRSRKNHRQAFDLPILGSDPSILEIVNISRSCSNVLVAVSERGNIPRQCHHVFDRLGDAVLKDAVDYHTSHERAAGPQPIAPSPVPRHSLSPNMEYPAIQATDYTMNNVPSGGWPLQNAEASSLLAVDDAFRGCFDDLQHFNESAFGEDPIGQLLHDWMGQIDGIPEH